MTACFLIVLANNANLPLDRIPVFMPTLDFYHTDLRFFLQDTIGGKDNFCFAFPKNINISISF